MKEPKWINDRYKILGRLGSGGSSTVYTAIDTKDEDRPEVAIKLLGQFPDTDQKLQQEFFAREVRALSTLSHTTIVRLLDSGHDEENQILYLVLEYLDGAQSLRRLLPKWEPDPLQCTDFIIELLEGVSYAHQSFIIHRDLNPGNILIDKYGNSKIIDFGVSKILGTLTAGQTVREFYTRPYASPEQIAHQISEYSSDIYSLAAVLFFMLTRKDPEDSLSLVEQFEALSDLPFQIRDVAQRMAAQDPSMRYSTAHLAAQALRSARRDLQSKSQKYYVLLTRTAISNLYDQAVTNSQDPSDARAVVDAALAPGVHIVLPRNATPDDYDLIGDGMSLRCVLANDNSHFVVKSILTRIPPHALEGLIQSGFPIAAQWQTSIQGDPIPSDASLAGLLDEADGFFQRKIVEQKRLERRLDLVETWRNLLDLERELKAKSLRQVTYSSWKLIKDNLVIKAQLTHKVNLDEIFSPGQLLTMSSKRGKPIAVGHYDQQDENHILISRLPGVKLDSVPSSGKILVDERQWAAAWSRQRSALYTIVDERCVNPRLPDILLDPKQAKRGIVEPIEQYFSSDLDEIKQNAVTTALNSQDIYLIQGPPGTGKTVLISEIVAQILKSNAEARILLVSQSNVAVDHVLTKVGQLTDESDLLPDVRIVRVGREEMVSLDAGEYLVDRKLETWAQAVKSRSDNYLTSHHEGSNERQELENLLVEVREDILPKAARRISKAEKEADEDLIANIEILRAHFPNLTIELTERSIKEVIATIQAQIDAHKSTLETTIENWQKRLNNLDEFEDIYFKVCSIVSGTCVGIAGKRNLPERFDWVIVDEAGRATPTEILIPLVRANRTILVGDHKQLPPVIEYNLLGEARNRSDIDPIWLDKSLFEYLFDQLDPELKTTLKVQYRMHPHIAHLVSSVFYAGILETGVSSDNRAHGWKRWSAAVVWYSTSQLDDRSEKEDEFKSKYNSREANIIEEQLLELEKDLRNRKEQKTVAVIAGYSAQVEQLERQLDVEDKKKWRAIDLEVSTVDAFQGREQDIVFYSVVRSNWKRTIGFLKDIPRLNVALSRARELLFIVGDHEMVAKAQVIDGLNPFREVIAHIIGNPSECALYIEESAK